MSDMWRIFFLHAAPGVFLGIFFPFLGWVLNGAPLPRWRRRSPLTKEEQDLLRAITRKPFNQVLLHQFYHDRVKDILK